MEHLQNYRSDQHGHKPENHPNVVPDDVVNQPKYTHCTKKVDEKTLVVVVLNEHFPIGCRYAKQPKESIDNNEKYRYRKKNCGHNGQETEQGIEKTSDRTKLLVEQRREGWVHLMSPVGWAIW